MHLYDYFRSSAGYRVRIALNLKGLAYTREEVSLIDGEQGASAHRARSPQGLVPVLDTGEAMLTQSLAIIEWLDATWPEPRLIPRDPTQRAAAMARALTIACDVHPLNNLRVLRHLERELGADQAARDRWYARWTAEGFAALEAMAGPGPFLGGEAPDLADICLVPQMYNARRFGVPVDAYARLVRADHEAGALPAFAAAHPDRVRGVTAF
ncbi:maleylacetoacetate isomerase [Stakelama saccharophila]|uniref:maleylacetoacetate isomerase n=1 Tax=Stakelama saccharophila TaxID=3075605 RepID=UPI003D785330